MQELYTIRAVGINSEYVYMCRVHKDTYMTHSKIFGNECYNTFFTKEEALDIIDYIKNTEPEFDKYTKTQTKNLNVYTHAQLKACTFEIEKIDNLF